MSVSEIWWSDVQASPEKLSTWLSKQFHGEQVAALRIRNMAAEAVADNHAKTLRVIADQEQRHADLIRGLLTSRSIPLGEHDTGARYWAKVQPETLSFNDKAAAATLAEGMRLERIRAIVASPDSPEDIRNVFKEILVDEVWHEKAFAAMTTPASIEKVRPNHNLGREVLGLEI